MLLCSAARWWCWHEASAKKCKVSPVLCVCGMNQYAMLLHMAKPMNETMNWNRHENISCGVVEPEQVIRRILHTSAPSNPHAILLLSCLALVWWTGPAGIQTKHTYPGSQVICSRQMFYLKTQSNTTGSFQRGWQVILRQSPIKQQLHSDERWKSQYMLLPNL